MGDGSIRIGGDARGSIIVQGEHNTITIYGERRLPADDEPAPLGPNPYRGLAAFQEEDRAVFFGREAITTRVARRVIEFFDGAVAARFLAVLGPSGSGKSSVVRAGLLPELARRGPATVPRLRVAVMTPTGDPLGALAQARARVERGEAAPAKARELADELRRDGGLLRVVTSLSPGGEAPLLLVVDQFEEVYTLRGEGEGEAARADRDRFVAELLAAADDAGRRLSVVIRTAAPLHGGLPPGVRTLVADARPDQVVFLVDNQRAYFWDGKAVSGPFATDLAGGDEVMVYRLSPDGRTFATARRSDAGTVDLLPTGGVVGTVQVRFGEPVLDLRFNDDGSALIAIAADARLLRRTLGWAELRRELRASTNACLTVEERTRFLGEARDQAEVAFDRCERELGRAPRNK